MLRQYVHYNCDIIRAVQVSRRNTWPIASESSNNLYTFMDFVQFVPVQSYIFFKIDYNLWRLLKFKECFWSEGARSELPCWQSNFTKLDEVYNVAQYWHQRISLNIFSSKKATFSGIWSNNVVLLSLSHSVIACCKTKNLRPLHSHALLGLVQSS